MCWICLLGASDLGPRSELPLVQPCRCPRWARHDLLPLRAGCLPLEAEGRPAPADWPTLTAWRGGSSSQLAQGAPRRLLRPPARPDPWRAA